MKIACIGIGNMGSSIMQSICKKYGKLYEITVANRTLEKAESFAKKNKVSFSEDNRKAVQDADFIFLAVKPNLIEKVIKEVSSCAKESAVFISMAAGISLERLESFDSKHRFVRIMPNLPAKIGESMTALCCNKNILDSELSIIKELMDVCGNVQIVPEKLMSCVTAVSGSGTAYAFMFMEALADSAVSFGMPREQAYIYVAQTLKGSAQMVLETNKHPAVLKDEVCSPAGTTIEAVKSLEAHGFRGAIIAGAQAAFEKSIQMGNN
ncbi:MAG: pyrroline-5-carboxylate reductase [Treponemataceae bacterium]